MNIIIVLNVTSKLIRLVRDLLGGGVGDSVKGSRERERERKRRSITKYRLPKFSSAFAGNSL